MNHIAKDARLGAACGRFSLLECGSRMTYMEGCPLTRRFVCCAAAILLSLTGSSASQNPPGLPFPRSLPTTPDDLIRVRLAAEQNDAEAEFTLCVTYFGGIGGVARDAATALRWCRRASAQGSDSATFFVGIIYDTSGEGVPPDRAEAMTWFRQAADHGNPVAQVRLGRAYEQGEGVQKDPVQAFSWYRLAAAQGNAIAENLLGDMFSDGRGVAQDDTQAAMWYRLSADQDNSYGVMKLAALYEKGAGVPRDRAEALRYYRLEADKGGPAAQFYVGVSYRDGRAGLTRDPIEAHKWFNIAAALAGENPAYGAARDALEPSMTQQDRMEARRRAHDWVELFLANVSSTPESDRVKQMLLAKVDGTFR
jgi:TPR repeat protein